MIGRPAALCTVAVFAIGWSQLCAAQSATGAESYIWNLDQQYPSDAEWNQDRHAIQNGLAKLERWQAQPITDASSLADLLEEMRRVRGLAGRMARFGLLTSNVDSRSPVAQARYDSGTALEAQVEAAVLPLEVKVRSLGQATVAAWQARERRLQPYGIKRRIDRIFREDQHSAPPSAQPVLAAMERWPRTTADIYETLVNQTIEWPTVPLPEGRSDPLTPNNYRTIRRNPHPNVRAQAARSFHDTLDRYESAMGLLFTRRLEGDVALAKARGFEDHMEASLIFRDGFPPGASQFSRTAARQHGELASRYAGLVARAFRKDRGTYADVLARSPWSFRGQFTLPEAIDLIVRSQSELGPEQERAVRRAFNSGLLHLAPAPNKTGIFGGFIQVGGGSPYGIGRFDGSLDNTRALAMLTQSMTLDMAIPEDGWPDRREDDQPVFGNSRWTLGQLLLDDLLYREAKTPERRAAALLDQLSRLWTEFFYRSATIELERWATAEIARGAPPTGQQISARYLALMRELNRSESGGLQIDDVYAREWMTEGTMFLGNHQLGFFESYVATVATAEALKRRDPAMLANFRTVRGRDLEYSYDILRQTGIDLASPQPYKAYARFMSAKMDQLERELDAMKL